MRIVFQVICIALLFFSCKKEQLVWEENFDTDSLDTGKWNFEMGNGCPNLCGWGNNEAQWYTDKNHTIKDGFLHITTKKEDDNYTSTKITTQKKFEFTYGRIEARAKLPVGKGIWPAIWLLGANITEVGWPLSGEIDMLEYVGREPGIVFNTVHTKASHGNTINTKKTKFEGIENGFHLFALDWTEKEISFYVDEVLTYTFTPKDYSQEEWPFNKPFYLIVNTAIGGNLGGHDIDDTMLPQDFVVDYIRVYQ